MRNMELEQRTKQFALRDHSNVHQIAQDNGSPSYWEQLLRSGTSVAANYREASRARTSVELRSKLGIVEGELDESLLWFELLAESGIVATGRLTRYGRKRKNY